MKKRILAASTIALSLFLVGCANDHVMHTNDGRTIVAEGKPQIDNDTGMITYKDAFGKEQQINRSDIKEMSQVGD